MSEAPYDEN